MEYDNIKRKKRALITGASGMLGRYVVEELRPDFDIVTLGRNEKSDIVCDLTECEPESFADRFDLVVHCAGTNREEDAYEVNEIGTKNLLKALKGNVPGAFVYISCCDVYGKTEGEHIDETSNTWTVTEVGRSKFEAERAVKDHFSDTDCVLTILRPTVMFGEGIKGEMNDLFQKVVNGRYIHVRGNEAQRSLVLAYDVAKVISRIYSIGGIYNVTDGYDRRRIDLAEAMSANAGLYKRMVFLPGKWVKLLSHIADRVSSLRSFAGTEVIAAMSKTLTFSNVRLTEAIDIKFHDTVEVIARRDKTYPYKD